MKSFLTIYAINSSGTNPMIEFFDSESLRDKHAEKLLEPDTGVTEVLLCRVDGTLRPERKLVRHGVREQPNGNGAH